MHPRLGLTERFYGWFTPAIAASDFAAAALARAPSSTARWTSSRCAADGVVSRERGALAIVLHTHMPYVEGFGTWPFGEEWLWEAMAGCYLPLLELLDGGAPLTLSLTPVLCDQLEAPGGERALRARSSKGFAARPTSATRPDCAAGGHEALARRAGALVGATTQAALERLRGRDGDLLGALAPHAAVDLLGDPRGAAAAGHRRGRAACRCRAASRPIAAASATAGAAASGCPSARTRRGSSGRSRTPA